MAGWESYKWDCSKGQYVRVPNPRTTKGRKPRARRRARAAARVSSRGLHYLKAEAPDGTLLTYMGGIKFARKGQPAPFVSKAQARAIGKQLKAFFPVLRGFKMRPT